MREFGLLRRFSSTVARQRDLAAHGWLGSLTLQKLTTGQDKGDRRQQVGKLHPSLEVMVVRYKLNFFANSSNAAAVSCSGFLRS
jgi:hypothetical protein